MAMSLDQKIVARKRNYLNGINILASLMHSRATFLPHSLVDDRSRVMLYTCVVQLTHICGHTGLVQLNLSLLSCITTYTSQLGYIALLIEVIRTDAFFNCTKIIQVLWDLYSY